MSKKPNKIQNGENIDNLNRLASGEPVRLAGFGTFDVRHIAAHEARNPKTSEPVQVPATHYPTFRAEKTLKANASSFNPADRLCVSFLYP